MKKHDHRKCSMPYNSQISIDILRRRVTCGGRKGRRAARRLQEIRCTAPPTCVARYMRRVGLGI